MLHIKNEQVKAERLTQEDAHYFFGYYDTPAWSLSDRYHLCHKVDFMDRLPHAADSATVGYIDMLDHSFHPVAETTAWNFQQGSMLQWHPAFPEEEIIYNTRDGETYRGTVQNIHTGSSRQLELPVANVDPTGTYAVSINFDRMFDFRPGYGYAGREDLYKEVRHSTNDGIFLIDLATGESRLVLSLQHIWDFTKSRFPSQDKKLLINHITFNTDGSRLVFLVRYFPEPGEVWETAILTVNRDGSDLFLLSDYSYASHYHWRDRESIVFHSRGAESGDAGDQLYVLRDLTHEAEIIDTTFFLRDGHCSYSPDRQYMLYDSYPDADGYRHLYVYSLKNKRGVTLGSYYSLPDIDGDIRCDLHPRWNRAGTHISFDSTHEGRRHVYVMDLRNVMESCC
ncbi:TolB family protein [Paenibacillus sp. LjRoot56]|uniref:TolB family protein n=1 Tax=Paenibacillus sp. LjRoot56 TaxID=3342333 RepID=UPI003ED0BB51